MRCFHILLKSQIYSLPRILSHVVYDNIPYGNISMTIDMTPPRRVAMEGSGFSGVAAEYCRAIPSFTTTMPQDVLLTATVKTHDVLV